MIVTHDEPAARSRTNYILRLSLAANGFPGRYEQVWTRTEDNVNFELCCIPFFTYDLSLGDVVRKTTDDGCSKLRFATYPDLPPTDRSLARTARLACRYGED